MIAPAKPWAEIRAIVAITPLGWALKVASPDHPDTKPLGRHLADFFKEVHAREAAVMHEHA